MGPIEQSDAIDVLGGGTISRHRLFERLSRGARVTRISAPAGSGKTYLARSWLADAGLTGSAAWVRSAGTRQFWTAVADAVRDTIPGSTLIRPSALAGGSGAGWLLENLKPLREPLVLVIDDADQLARGEAPSQLEYLVAAAPADLRFVFLSRQDRWLGLHRLRLEGQVTEIRATDLRFSVAEARELFAVAGVTLPEPVLAALVGRTEGWAAGLRLAALSLAGHPDPVRFAAEFSGSERTVAEYLLAEVLDRQPEHVRRLLVRTSVCDRVSGELADRLTGGSGGERVLQDLEDAGAFVESLDARRSWFRYHPMFADLLQFELRRADPAAFAALLGAVAGWYADQGYPAGTSEASRQPPAEPGPCALALFSIGSAGPGPLSLDVGTPRLIEPVSESETRVLRFLPTNLSAQEIADQLFVSVNTVRTHMRHVYEKLGVHRRAAAVDRARALGLLTPSSRGL